MLLLQTKSFSSFFSLENYKQDMHRMSAWHTDWPVSTITEDQERNERSSCMILSLTTSWSRPTLEVPSRMKLWLNSCQRNPPLKFQENQWANSCHVQEWDRFPVAGPFSYQCLCNTSIKQELVPPTASEDFSAGARYNFTNVLTELLRWHLRTVLDRNDLCLVEDQLNIITRMNILRK